MKAEAIKAVGNVVTSAIKSSSKNEAVAKEAIKGGERLMAAGQDATAVQGRAVVKPYVKPEMKDVNLNKNSLKAASGSPEVNPPMSGGDGVDIPGPGLGYWLGKLGDLWI